jgi:hypothetical protein
MSVFDQSSARKKGVSNGQLRQTRSPFIAHMRWAQGLWRHPFVGTNGYCVDIDVCILEIVREVAKRPSAGILFL